MLSDASPNMMRRLLLTRVARADDDAAPLRAARPQRGERAPVREALIAKIVELNPHLSREGAIALLRKCGEL